jgi:hypothetical protein
MRKLVLVALAVCIGAALSSCMIPGGWKEEWPAIRASMDQTYTSPTTVSCTSWCGKHRCHATCYSW